MSAAVKIKNVLHVVVVFFLRREQYHGDFHKANETAVENEQHSSLVPADVPSLLCVVSFIVLCCLLPHVFSVANYNINN